MPTGVIDRYHSEIEPAGIVWRTVTGEERKKQAFGREMKTGGFSLPAIEWSEAG